MAGQWVIWERFCTLATGARRGINNPTVRRLHSTEFISRAHRLDTQSARKVQSSNRPTGVFIGRRKPAVCIKYFMEYTSPRTSKAGRPGTAQLFVTRPMAAL